MEAERGLREVIVDTYALLAIAYDEVGNVARKVLENVRRRCIRGLIPGTVAMEYTIHWYRGRIPALKNIDEVRTYLTNYFTVVELDLETYLEAAKIKVRGDEILKKAEDARLRERRLSIVDSTVIALAKRKRAPILTGDRDLTYVATSMGLEVLW